MAGRTDSLRLIPLARRLLGKPKAPVSRVAAIDVEYAGVVHLVSLKRVATARRFTLKVRAARGDVVLTMPPNGSAKAAAAFAHRNAEWIAERVAQLEPTVAFAPDVEIPFRGELHRLTSRAGLRRRVWAAKDTDGQSLLCVSGPDAAFGGSVAAFLRREAAADFSEAVGRHAARVNRPVRAIRLRDTRSRWGSCSAQGVLNFSWRLVMAPRYVLDYLAAHEVAHLVHMNHSKAFWSVTLDLAPQTDRAEAWLKTNGSKLHRYGA